MPKYMVNYYHLNQLASQGDAMKNNNRINLRKERKFQNYNSFLCLSFLQLYFDHINKTNNNDFLKYDLS